MRTPDIFFVLAAVLAVAVSSVRSEYTWNGSEWVWEENKNPQPPANSIEDEEGSGDGGGGGRDYYYEEDDDDTGGFDDYEGSGDDDFSQTSFNNNQNPKKTANWPTREDPYDSYVDPYDNSRGSQDNRQTYYSTSPPYFGNDVEKTEDIFVDPPGSGSIPQTTTTTSTVVPPRDPSISSRPKNTTRSTSFFAQPGTLAAVIGGAVVGLLCAILCVMFVVYRMRKKDEGSYALDEPKRSPTVNAYAKHPSREFYA